MKTISLMSSLLVNAALFGFIAYLFLSPEISTFLDVGEVTHLSGKVTVKHADGTDHPISIGFIVTSGDSLTTGPQSDARIKFVNGGQFVMRSNSELKMNTLDHRIPQLGSVERIKVIWCKVTELCVSAIGIRK